MVDDDEQNPLSKMLPPADNPEYHRKKAEYEENLGSEAGKEAMHQHGYLAERVQRVRKDPPQAATPAPPRPGHRQSEEPTKGTGLEIDPNIATRYPANETPAPEPAAPAAPVHAETPATVRTSPLLQKLRQDFGIEAIPLEDIKIGSHVFTMRVLDGNAVTTSVRFADTLSISPRENELNLQTCLTSFAVVAIDGEPLWKVFEIPLEEKERVYVEGRWKSVFDPNMPPDRVRLMASTKFMDFLNKEATMDLMSELWTHYKKEVDPKGSIDILLKVASNESGEESEDLPLR